MGFPDRQGFGRRPMQIPAGELAAMVTYQLGALAGIARAEGAAMTHMSFHGALGNMTAADPALADPLVEAVARFDDALTISSSPSAAIEGAAARCGLRVATTFLADRACDRNGLLVPRGKPGAVIHDEAAVLARVERLLKEGVVETSDGTLLPAKPESILLHGDTPGAVALGKALRDLVEGVGWTVTPISRLHDE